MNRTEREAAVAADLEADRIVAQAKKINRTIIAAMLAMAAVLVGFNWPMPEAHSAKRPVYTGTVGVIYGQGVTSAYGSGKFDPKRWDVPAAVKAANADGKLGKLKVVQVKSYKECWEILEPSYCVMIATGPDALVNGNSKPGQPYAVHLAIDRGLPLKYQLLESDVYLSDKVGAKATAAQRQAWLVAALKTAIPR